MYEDAGRNLSVIPLQCTLDWSRCKGRFSKKLHLFLIIKNKFFLLYHR
ncbi:hypothetical protein SELSPUOL_00559 [Selenomonas sputigena ATCC 35185]|uniref:Uncharacterized protein n=1 Tax=Selenomonas sputigena (strain ATCC 35185 / DSM 20758 / CCUG 44933 / VPI D19B-28) TaxID=546271 RepID=C9LSX9_SELS3|nr:hypothetical protein SELSPUOL_00559 [Selenomonas sputigena ATCC 35185]